MTYEVTPSCEKMTALTVAKGLEGKVIKDAEAETKYSFLAENGSIIALGDTVNDATKAIEKLDVESEVDSDSEPVVEEGPCEDKVVMAKTEKGIVNYHIIDENDPPTFQIQIVDQKAKDSRPFFKLPHNAILLINENSCHDFDVPDVPKDCDVEIYEPVVEEEIEE